MFTLTEYEFETWLQGYQHAWQARDSQAAAALFTPDAEYFWTPFDPPQRGHAEIAAAWTGAVEKQKDVRFEFKVLGVSGASGIAHWHTKLTSVPEGAPVELDGILIADFASAQHCRRFREWWHLKA
jgi:ketosteroid isomerase-like protein